MPQHIAAIRRCNGGLGRIEEMLAQRRRQHADGDERGLVRGSPRNPTVP